MVAPVAAAAGRAVAGRGAAAAGARSAGKVRPGAGAAGKAPRGKVRRGMAGGAAGDVAAPTAADDRALRAQLRGQDAGYAAAYAAGQVGDELGPDADDATRAAWEAGAAERRRGRRDRALGAAGTVPGLRGPAVVNDGAGFVLGLIIYALVLNYLQGGAAQARGWIAAKFVNRPYRAPAKRGGRK